ncbi:MAG: serine/threonine-protein kinase [Acidobacteriota bacterium]
MDAERWQRAQALFTEALDVEPAARAGFLEGECGDAELVAEVLSLLAAHDGDGALEIESSLVSDDGPAPDPLIGTQLGPHRLIRRLGRGGMGDVYLGERWDEQYRQRVAIKLVRPGLGGDLASRLRTERQILARLDHPRIAPLLDGGVSADGRPYLVMPFVDGLPLTDYCQRRRPTVEQRLRLFLQVLEAVHFAHLHLVVHRDLKPGNILVTEGGDVKLLDFGIAKLLDPRAFDLATAVTRTEQRLMTPEYAAPEQIRGEAITTATDVYTLGVVLYELLAGQRPHRVTGRAPADVERLVCQTVPRRPSLAVGGEDGGAPADGERPDTATVEARSAERRTTPAKLRRRLRGDLDNIVMMALRHEPSRRYPSVEAMAEDLRRHLDGRPVTARRDTASYRLGKFVRRHRLAVAAAVAVMLLTLAFGVTTAIQLARVAEQAQALEAERDRVRLEEEKARRVKGLVGDLFKAMDPDEPGGSSSERLQVASDRLVADLADEPELQAELMDEVLTIYSNLGLYDAGVELATKSLEVRRRVFPEQDPAVAWGLLRLGEAYFLSSRFAEAEEFYREALALQRATLGPDHVDVARSLMRLSRLYRSGQNPGQSIAVAQEALDILRAHYGEWHGDVGDAWLHLALAQRYGPEPESAAPLLRRALDVQRATLGPEHPNVAWTLSTLAVSLVDGGELEEAETRLQEALQIQRRRYRDDHPDLSRTHLQLGRLYLARGELAKSEMSFREALTVRRRSLGDGHSATAAAMTQLARVLVRQGRFAEAEALLLEALPVRRSIYGTEHRFFRQSAKALADLYRTWRKPEQETVYRRLAEPPAVR